MMFDMFVTVLLSCVFYYTKDVRTLDATLFPCFLLATCWDLVAGSWERFHRKQFIQVSHRVEIHPSEAAKALGFCWDYAEAMFFVALIFCFAISLAMTIARWTDRWHQTSINWAPWFHDQTKPGIQKCRRKPKVAVSRQKEKKQKMDLVQWQRTSQRLDNSCIFLIAM